MASCRIPDTMTRAQLFLKDSCCGSQQRMVMFTADSDAALSPSILPSGGSHTALAWSTDPPPLIQRKVD